MSRAVLTRPNFKNFQPLPYNNHIVTCRERMTLHLRLYNPIEFLGFNALRGLDNIGLKAPVKANKTEFSQSFISRRMSAYSPDLVQAGDGLCVLRLVKAKGTHFRRSETRSTVYS